jgi:hypothetical protein
VFRPIDGNFSVLLWGGAYPSGVIAAASISQTGEIPPGTQSLLFDAGGGPEDPPAVFIGNDGLTLFPVGSGTGGNGVAYTVWGGNISSWAGQNEQLTFSEGVTPSFIALIDDISFSPIAVIPEPSPLVLTGIGGLLFGLYRRFAP